MVILINRKVLQFVCEIKFDTQCILLDLWNLACTSARTRNKTCLKKQLEVDGLTMRVGAESIGNQEIYKSHVFRKGKL